jgi:hypothetical protein
MMVHHVSDATTALHFHDENGERRGKACVHQQSGHHVLQCRVLREV